MRIFISWSGNLSHQIALILRDWLPNVIQVIDPYVSSEDVDKGTRWIGDISKELSGASLGIICLTRSNLRAPWILFEAGALSKSIDRARVIPLLIDLPPSDIEGPLLQFQATSIAREDIRKMVKDINASMGDQAIDPMRIEKSFQIWWPYLEKAFSDAKSRESDSAAAVSVRSERELLEETLELARQISKSTAGDGVTDIVSSIRALDQQVSSLSEQQERAATVYLETLSKQIEEGVFARLKGTFIDFPVSAIESAAPQVPHGSASVLKIAGITISGRMKSVSLFIFGALIASLVYTYIGWRTPNHEIYSGPQPLPAREYLDLDTPEKTSSAREQSPANSAGPDIPAALLAAIKAIRQERDFRGASRLRAMDDASFAEILLQEGYIDSQAQPGYDEWRNPREAVRSIQKKYGLAPDGHCGPQTELLMAALWFKLDSDSAGRAASKILYESESERPWSFNVDDARRICAIDGDIRKPVKQALTLLYGKEVPVTECDEKFGDGQVERVGSAR